MTEYDPRAYFEVLGYQPGSQPYTCPGLRSLSVYCKGDPDQLEAALRPTPFTLAGDRFMISIADFGNCSMGPFFDAGIVIPVTYKGNEGAHYLLEWEDQSWSIALGRELWGYPKRFADISLEYSETGAEARVEHRGETIIDLDVAFDDNVRPEAWAGTRVFPHLQARAAGQPGGPSFDRFDIISRDTSKDFELLEARRGSATVAFGPSACHGTDPLTVVDVLGAEYTVGNYHASIENGIPSVIDSLASTNESLKTGVPMTTNSATVDGAAPARKNLAELAYRQLRDRIVSLEVQPLEPLEEKKLSADFQVGLAPIRDAFKRLEQDHLVVIYPRRGTFAAPVGLNDLQAVMELRLVNEGLAASLAAERSSPAERRQLHQMALDLAQVRDKREMIGADAELHRTVARLARNPYLEAVVERHLNLSVRLWFLCNTNFEIPVDVGVDHTAMTSAILTGDGTTAAEKLREHIVHDSEQVRELLATQRPR